MHTDYQKAITALAKAPALYAETLPAMERYQQLLQIVAEASPELPEKLRAQLVIQTTFWVDDGCPTPQAPPPDRWTAWVSRWFG